MRPNCGIRSRAYGALPAALVGLCVVAVFVGACQGTGRDGGLTVADALTVLERGQARGHATLTSGGSPAALGMKQTFFLGPENASLSFDGNIDFGGGERPKEIGSASTD
jgi:hypothetical protein